MKTVKKQGKTIITRLLAVATLILCVPLFFGCQNVDAKRFDEISEMTEDRVATLTDQFKDAESASAYLDALIAFADEQQMYYYRAADEEAVIFVKQPVGNTGEKTGTTLQCSIDPAKPEDSALTCGLVLSVLEHADNAGKLTAVFTLAKSVDQIGLKSVPESFLNDGDFISITAGGETGRLTKSAGAYRYEFQRKCTSETLDDNTRRLYRVSITGLSGEAVGKEDVPVPNPITPIYRILDYCESNHLDYHIIDVTSEGSAFGNPSACTLTVAVGASDVTRFRSKVDKELDSFEEDCGDAEPDLRRQVLVMTTEESEALSTTEATKVISMLYTIKEHYDYINTDEEENTIGKTDTTQLTITPTACTIGVTGYYEDPIGYDRGKETFSSLAELNEFTFGAKTVTKPYEAVESDLWRRLDICADLAKCPVEERDMTLPVAINTLFPLVKEREVAGLLLAEKDLDAMVETLIRYVESQDQKSPS